MCDLVFLLYFDSLYYSVCDYHNRFLAIIIVCFPKKSAYACAKDLGSFLKIKLQSMVRINVGVLYDISKCV